MRGGIRDYVIESFNQDRTFDRFMMEQVAGDLLPAEDWQQSRRQVTATAFLALGNTNLAHALCEHVLDLRKLVERLGLDRLKTAKKTFAPPNVKQCVAVDLICDWAIPSERATTERPF